MMIRGRDRKCRGGQYSPCSLCWHGDYLRDSSDHRSREEGEVVQETPENEFLQPKGFCGQYLAFRVSSHSGRPGCGVADVWRHWFGGVRDHLWFPVLRAQTGSFLEDVLTRHSSIALVAGPLRAESQGVVARRGRGPGHVTLVRA